MSTTTKLFAECRVCGARWHAAMLPLSVSLMTRMAKGLHCPWCAADGRHIGMCCTEGQHAVAEPRAPIRAYDRR
jgi:hypothetical protein